MGGEARLWSWLSGQLSSGPHLSRIENPCDPGTPDVNVCVDRLEAWLELKYTDHLRPLGRRGLRPSQRIWIARRLSAGGRVGIIVGVRERVLFLPGSLYSDVNDLTPDRLVELAYLVAMRRQGIKLSDFRRFLRKL